MRWGFSGGSTYAGHAVSTKVLLGLSSVSTVTCLAGIFVVIVVFD